MRLVHTADWHWEAEKLEKCQASADFIIAKLREIKPDLHVIAGDYWNRRQTLTSASAFKPAIDALTAMANICPTVIIKGNNEHDAEGSIEWLKDLETVHPIYATERAESILFFTGNASQRGDFPTFTPWGWINDRDFTAVASAAGVLHLFPYPTKQHFLADKPGLSIDESNLLIQDAIRKIMLGFGAISTDAKCPVVLVGHCNVLGATLSSGQTLLGQDIMISKHDLALAGADYVALGHIHKEQEIGENIYYSGSTYHCNFGETEAKVFNLVEMDEHSGGLAVVEHIVIPSRPLSLHEGFIIDAPDSSDARPFLDDTTFFANDWIGAELRIRIHATKERINSISDDELKEMLYPGAYSYTIERIIIPDERIRSSEIVRAKTLREKMTEWGKSIEKEIPPEVLECADETERSCAP